MAQGAAWNPPQESPTAAPQGDGEYVVGEAECINSIARKNGFYWETLWNRPENAALKAARKDHNILLPGDRVHLPEKQLREEECATGRRHRFQTKGELSRIKLRLLENDSPDAYANQPYLLTVDGESKQGTVDANGDVELEIDPAARTATLTVGEETFELNIAGLDPVDSIRGAQQRLQSLGFHIHGAVQDEWDEESVEALRKFQSAYVLESNDESPSGRYDSKTRAKLAEIYGC